MKQPAPEVKKARAMAVVLIAAVVVCVLCIAYAFTQRQAAVRLVAEKDAYLKACQDMEKQALFERNEATRLLLDCQRSK